MITQKQLNSLQQIKRGSWAIWDEKGNNDLAFFRKNIKKLHGKVVFLGLNKSGKKRLSKLDKSAEYEFGNFHSKNHIGDETLANFFKGNRLKNLEGSYMTDLHQEIDGNSNNINKSISDIKKNFSNVLKEILLINQNNINIICFGDKVFDNIASVYLKDIKPSVLNNNIRYFSFELSKNKQNVKINIFRVMHYSYIRRNPKILIKTLGSQLLFLNKYIIKFI